jgi:hypothetical protein
MSPERYPYNRPTWMEIGTLTDTPDKGEWRCPYCGTVMPDGVDHPSVWECCGEMGHAEHWHFDNRPALGSQGMFGKVRGWVKSDHDEKLY